ncbi:hypothetical protein C0993_011082 [Termitomyces sp. T159_Od127]|nr:hypothetical protein C0993_011082 [Termitomyces sp. T159_Od127]
MPSIRIILPFVVAAFAVVSFGVPVEAGKAELKGAKLVDADAGAALTHVGNFIAKRQTDAFQECVEDLADGDLSSAVIEDVCLASLGVVPRNLRHREFNAKRQTDEFQECVDDLVGGDLSSTVIEDICLASLGLLPRNIEHREDSGNWQNTEIQQCVGDLVGGDISLTVLEGCLGSLLPRDLGHHESRLVTDLEDAA